MTMVDLKAEAAAEACRVANVRALTRTGDVDIARQLEGDRPWIVSARTRLRRRLHDAVLLVFRVAYEDATGAVVESYLVPVVVALKRQAGGRESRATARALVTALEHCVRPHVDVTSASWRCAAERGLRAVVVVRAARAEGIARSASGINGRAYQPGLFDRRVERQRLGATASIAEAEQTISDRFAAVERLAAAQPQTPQLLLAVVP